MRVNPSTSPPSAGPRFLGIFFTHWLVDLEVALLRRAIAWRASQEASHAASQEASHIPAQLALPLPVVVVEERSRVLHVVGCCDQALAHGVRVGMTASQAETMCPPHQADARFIALLSDLRQRHGRIAALSDRLLAIQWDPKVAARAMHKLGRCLERWIPVVALDDDAHRHGRAPCVDALIGDFTGCARLFRGKHGTEQELLRRIQASFARRGLRVQIVSASTIGAASGMGRCMRCCMGRQVVRGTQTTRIAIPAGAEGEMLDPLPMESLRIAPAAVEALRSVEIETIGQLARLGRTGIAERLSGRSDSEPRAPGVAKVRQSSSSSSSSSSRRSSRHAASTPLLSPASLFDPEPTVAAAMLDFATAPRVSVRVQDDVLLRLDQALGRAPETLTPIRSGEPLVFRHHFDGPCARVEPLYLACGGLIDKIASSLAVRREALRFAMWTFHHAELPADLSTDQSSDARRGRAVGAFDSRIELRLARPSSRRVHLWSVFRTRLERLPLDHGVESIECKVEQSVLQRFRQARLVEEDGRDGAGAGQIGAWIDLVASRMGDAAIVRPSTNTQPMGRPREARLETDPSAAQRARMPSIKFDTPEFATLVAGSASAAIARALATRTAWAARSILSPGSAPCADHADAVLHWRGVAWPLRAIDGWERRAETWWGALLARTPATKASRALVGLVTARMQIGEGLWVLVRFPASLPARVHHAATDWLAGSAASIAHGVDLSVIGVWG